MGPHMRQNALETGWTLHPQIAQDCVPIGDLPLSRVLINRDATYPWLLLVPRRAGACEMFDLDATERAQLSEETALVGHLLKTQTRCRKINIGALGNIVPQLHIHVVARSEGDPAWPGPVWGHAPMQPYEPAAFEAFRAMLERNLPLGPDPAR
jgi:diadenosine tetraphosphate (Ap4A) HIT family hydrolase